MASASCVQTLLTCAKAQERRAMLPDGFSVGYIRLGTRLHVTLRVTPPTSPCPTHIPLSHPYLPVPPISLNYLPLSHLPPSAAPISPVSPTLPAPPTSPCPTLSTDTELVHTCVHVETIFSAQCAV